MKTVAIVSFIGVENYGANLQAFALQEKLKQLGFKPIYINYSHQSSLSGIKKIVNVIWSFFRLLLGYAKRYNKTTRFRTDFMYLTKKINNLEELNNLPRFDYYVVGSDQVWLPRILSVSDGFYFLNFAPKGSKKISYASSFGTSKIPKYLDKIYFNYLSEFREISVREKQGASYLEGLGIKSSVVLDPTLLLKENEWIKTFDLKSKDKKPYILCYVMTGDHKGAKFISDLCRNIIKTEKSKYKVIVIGDKEYKKLNPKYNLITDAGPQDFLNYVFNADYIITNSFHGTCFSLNFQKKFITVLHRNNCLNSRITDLLEVTSLSERIIYTDTNVNTVNLSKFDYEPDIDILNELREQSMTYLKNAMK